MDQEKLESLKTAYLELVTNLIKDFGGLSPAVTILGIKKDDQLNAVIHIPIPDKYMNSETSKDEFVDDVVPQLAAKVKEEFDVHAVAWASEAWLRVLSKDGEPVKEVPEDWKSLPKKEVLFINIESEGKEDLVVMEIVRKGQQVNSEGQLTDHVELVPYEDLQGQPDKVEGRFTGLYKKFTTV